MEEPLYNIGVVTRLTGISTSTLRAWERRYGFPKASRTAGGHRLYSEKDIVRLRWVKSQMDAGVAVSRAIVAAHAYEAEGQLFPPFTRHISGREEEKSPTTNLQDSLFEALIHHDLPGADRLMGEELAFHSPEDLTLDIIGPVLARVGDAWEKGQITVATEHLASNYLRHRLLMWMVTGSSIRPGKPIVLACAPGEWHEGSLLMLGVLLRRRGWQIAYLGQDMPFQSLSIFIKDIQPSAVVLVSMREATAQTLADWTQWISQVNGKPLVLFGGRAFLFKPELQKTIPGVYLGDNIQDGVRKLESLLR